MINLVRFFSKIVVVRIVKSKVDEVVKRWLVSFCLEIKIDLSFYINVVYLLLKLGIVGCSL